MVVKTSVATNCVCITPTGYDEKIAIRTFEYSTPLSLLPWLSWLHYRFLQHPLQFIILVSFFHSTVYSEDVTEKVSLNKL